jgi:hypothetical protein
VSLDTAVAVGTSPMWNQVDILANVDFLHSSRNARCPVGRNLAQASEWNQPKRQFSKGTSLGAQMSLLNGTTTGA